MKRTYQNKLAWRNKVARVMWEMVYIFFYRHSPRPMHAWRRFLLRSFGAKVGTGAHPYPRAKIWAPWNLTLGDYSGLANDVECYSVDRVIIGPHVTVSQQAFLCTATHDYRSDTFKLITKPITIDAEAWIAAGAFIGPGVRVGARAVVAARAVVVKDVKPEEVVAGNPCRRIGVRHPVPT